MSSPRRGSKVSDCFPTLCAPSNPLKALVFSFLPSSLCKGSFFDDRIYLSGIGPIPISSFDRPEGGERGKGASKGRRKRGTRLVLQNRGKRKRKVNKTRFSKEKLFPSSSDRRGRRRLDIARSPPTISTPSSSPFWEGSLAVLPSFLLFSQEMMFQSHFFSRSPPPCWEGRTPLTLFSHPIFNSRRRLPSNQPLSSFADLRVFSHANLVCVCT